MSFLLHLNILDAFIGSNNGKHIFTFCTLKKRLRMPLITGQLLILLYCSTWISLYMNWTLVLSKTSLCSCLVVTCPAWILLSFMYCTLVFIKITLWSCLVVAFPAWVFLSFMNWTLVLSKTSLCSGLVVTFPAWTPPSFMYWMLVLSKTSICSCLVLAFTAWILLFFMNCLLVNPNPINLLKCILRFVLNFNTASSLNRKLMSIITVVITPARVASGASSVKSSTN